MVVIGAVCIVVVTLWWCDDGPCGGGDGGGGHCGDGRCRVTRVLCWSIYTLVYGCPVFC